MAIMLIGLRELWEQHKIREWTMLSSNATGNSF